MSFLVRVISCFALALSLSLSLALAAPAQPPAANRASLPT